MQKVTIMLVVLICFNSMGGFLFSICHGSDGHVAIEALSHHHCNCEDSDKIYANRASLVTLNIYPAEHSHCKDFRLISNLLLEVRKNVKSFSSKVFYKSIFVRWITFFTQVDSCKSFLDINQLFSYHTPLRTIILLS